VVVLVFVDFTGFVLAFVFVLFLQRRFAPVVDVGQPELPAVRAVEVGADLDHRGGHAGCAGGVGDFFHQPFAAEGLHAEHQIERRRRSPVQAQAVVVPVAAEEGPVQQGPLDEVVGMRVLLVQVADLRREATGAQLQARRQGGGFEPGFFHALFELAVVGREGGGHLRAQQRAQRPAGRQVAVAELQALVARAQGQRARCGRQVEHGAEIPALGGLGLGQGRAKQRR
jgi:hypothetical protein